MTQGLLEVHFTECQELLRCYRKWYDSNYLQLEPLEKSSAMNFGSVFHRLKESYLKMDDAWTTPDITAGLSPQDNHLMTELFRVWREWFREQHYDYVQVEQPLSIPLLGVTFTVTPDGLFHDGDELWMDETKTTGSFDEDRLHLDLQGRVQMLVARELGYDVAGVKYVQVRKSNPSTAKVDILREFEVRFPEGALRDAAFTIEHAVDKIKLYRSALDTGYADLDRMLIRNSNPISFMDCACPFDKACIASFMGRETEALATLYKTKEPR